MSASRMRMYRRVAVADQVQLLVDPHAKPRSWKTERRAIQHRQSQHVSIKGDAAGDIRHVQSDMVQLQDAHRIGSVMRRCEGFLCVVRTEGAMMKYQGLTIWTIGHSNHSFEHFLDLLMQHDLSMLADVRRFPGSRAFSQFNQENL